MDLLTFFRKFPKNHASNRFIVEIFFCLSHLEKFHHVFLSFFRAHFNYNNPEKSEMSFNKSDVFHVVDTLHNGVVGSWQAFRMGK